MQLKRLKNYEYVIKETRTYVVTAAGRTEFDAEQDAISRFHRLRKSNELQPMDISKPRIASVEEM